MESLVVLRCRKFIEEMRITRQGDIKDLHPGEMADFISDIAELVGYFDPAKEHKELLEKVDKTLDDLKLLQAVKAYEVVEELRDKYAEYRHMYEDLC